MATITVERLGDGSFDVIVTDDRSTSRHRVTAEAPTLAGLAPETDAEEVVAASFRFLLDREPKESILRSFDLSVISRYFPEYESRLSDYTRPGASAG